MSLMKKIKSIFKRSEADIEPPKEIPESKLKGLKIYAPELVIYEGDREPYSVYIHDKDNNPIQDEMALINIVGRTYHPTTDENGIGILPLNLKPKTYNLTVKYPAEVYSPVIETKVSILKEDEELDDSSRLYAPSMTIYINEEPDYLIRLTTKDNEPIPDEEVILTVDETSYNLVTDKEGFASIFLKLEEGTHPITAEFKGNENNSPVCVESELTYKIRNIDREVMIEIENLTMEFKVSKDKIDTLKEYVIRTIKRNKSEHKKVKVLDDISFKIYKGERMGILGLNGAGKSTLLKILAGIYEPTSGTIKAYGKIAPLLELGAGFDKNYTGENNIYLNGAFLSMTEDFIDDKFDEIVEFSELGEYIKYPVKNYSSGMRAKLGFSIATLVEPDILIVDEILSVGDIKFRKKSSEKIQSMMHDGVTVLLVSHSIEQIRTICDRCIWLEDGKIVMEGDSDLVCAKYVDSARIK